MLLTGNRPPLPLALCLLLATVVFAAPSRRLFGSSKDSWIGPDSTNHASADKIEELERYAMLSAIAYCQLGTWDCGDYCDAFPNMTLISTFTTLKTGAAGYIARDDSTDSLYIVFRGTYSLSNKFDDITFRLVNYTYYLGAMVHDGFLKYWDDATARVYPVVKHELAHHPNDKVYVLGHSLGGGGYCRHHIERLKANHTLGYHKVGFICAAAVLAALYLHIEIASLNKSNLFVYTFGEPRVGDALFAFFVSLSGIQVIRVINQNDIVPMLPPLSTGFKVDF
ncbi:Alpha/Beta hydrolase protein [Endogone sp. FLAS-F59071]|nr:Alpha/Beta hydrolase protein [Endogone sp. FLAS-F59071]|eukprot:RUS15362.1 Alpha/Beta hydrolase protein [Endogone sp. FLAS-F59071]